MAVRKLGAQPNNGDERGLPALCDGKSRDTGTGQGRCISCGLATLLTREREGKGRKGKKRVERK